MIEQGHQENAPPSFFKITALDIGATDWEIVKEKTPGQILFDQLYCLFEHDDWESMPDHWRTRCEQVAQAIVDAVKKEVA